jgi:hypothetical protein
MERSGEMEIMKRLRHISVELERILLDPNNPRIREARSAEEPEETIDSEEVQKETFQRLKEDEDIEDLWASIGLNGLLPLSVIVVRKHFKPNSDKYVVIEGNRRVAAIKWIMSERPPEIPEDVIARRREELRRLNVLELETTPEKLESDRLLLQGIVHISPTREWPAFARALACKQLELQGMQQPSQIARALGGGISPTEVGRLLRAYDAYGQMLEHPEYGYEAKRRREFLSYFSEVIAKRTLRQWLGWDEQQRKFTNEENLEKLYELFVREKIRRMTDIRFLPTILNYAPETIDRMLEEPEYSIDQAWSEAVRRMQPPSRPVEWRNFINQVITILESGISLPFTREDLILFQKLKSLAERRLKDIERYLQLKSTA